MSITNRIKHWGLTRFTCVLCEEFLCWGIGFNDEIWCDECAKQAADSEDLESSGI
jgi:hypothetical protein